jgi:L-ascorbate metabolism protein UlaG (beta-lactamase superfamily)
MKSALLFEPESTHARLIGIALRETFDTVDIACSPELARDSIMNGNYDLVVVRLYHYSDITEPFSIIALATERKIPVVATYITGRPDLIERAVRELGPERVIPIDYDRANPLGARFAALMAA